MSIFLVNGCPYEADLFKVRGFHRGQETDHNDEVSVLSGCQ